MVKNYEMKLEAISSFLTFKISLYSQHNLLFVVPVVVI